MAPELIRGEGQYTEAVDIYSLAMVVFEAWTHETPFSDMHMGQIALYVGMQGKRPQLWYCVDPVHQALQDLMVRCWDQEPEKRPKAIDVATELGRIRSMAGKGVDEF
jgi:serine/threonine protein kinase